MRSYRAYVSLMARSTLYKELLLFVAMAAVELILVIPNLGMQISSVVSIDAQGKENLNYFTASLDSVVQESRLVLVWLAALLVLSLILILTAGQWRDYTLDRLGMSRLQGNILYGIYCTLSFVLLWGFQAALAVGMCLYYRQQLPSELVSGQTLFFSICGTPLFFDVLPLMHVGRWVSDVLIMTALGFSAANGARLRRLGRMPAASVVGVALLFWSAYGQVGVSTLDVDVGYILGSVCFVSMAVAQMTVWDIDERKGEAYEPLNREL